MISIRELKIIIYVFNQYVLYAHEVRCKKMLYKEFDPVLLILPSRWSIIIIIFTEAMEVE